MDLVDLVCNDAMCGAKSVIYPTSYCIGLLIIHRFQGAGRLQPSGSAVYGNCDFFPFRGTGLGEPGAAGVSWDDSDRSYSGNYKGLGARGFQPDHLYRVVDVA